MNELILWLGGTIATSGLISLVLMIYMLSCKKLNISVPVCITCFLCFVCFSCGLAVMIAEYEDHRNQTITTISGEQ